MSIDIPLGRNNALSVPVKFVTPRPLSADEINTLRAIADVLIPADGENPAATSEPGFDDSLTTAANARADAFDAIVQVLEQLRGQPTAELDQVLRALHADRPHVFQPLSAIVAGAWLLLPTVRERLGYPGQRRAPAPLEQAADELSTGILDPVLERGFIYTPAPD